MKPLSTIPIDSLRQLIGGKVVSLATGTIGTLISISDKIDREDYTMDIDWDNGNKSYRLWHFWADQVAFVSEMSDL